MATESLSGLTPFDKGQSLAFIEHEGEPLFAAEEIGKQLGYKTPAKSINILFSRNQKELRSYATCIKLMQVDGCLCETRCFTEEGVYILSMLAQTPRAAEFRARLARLLREFRERRLDLARQSGYELGLAEARALPAAEAERKAAYLDGMKEGVKIQRRRDGLARLLKALRFTRAGLTQKDAGAALGMTGGAVGKMLARARAGGVIA